MNGANLHLTINHLAIAGVFCGAMVLLTTLWNRNELIVRTGLFLIVLTGALTVATFISGQSTQNIGEHLPEFTEGIIHFRADAVENSTWLVSFTSLLALIGLALSFERKMAPKSLVLFVLILSFLTLGFLGWSNRFETNIGHQEFRVK